MAKTANLRLFEAQKSFLKKFEFFSKKVLTNRFSFDILNTVDSAERTANKTK